MRLRFKYVHSANFANVCNAIPVAQFVAGLYPGTQEHENVESESLVHVPPCSHGKLAHGSAF